MRSPRFRSWRVSTLLALSLVLGQACKETSSSCSNQPLGDVTVFVEDLSGASSWTLTGTLTAEPEVTESGLRKYRLRDNTALDHVLVYGAPGEGLPLTVGTEYTVVVETVPGMPTPCGVVITQDGKLCFAAASDYRDLSRVNAQGVPGFSLHLDATDCTDQAQDPCFTTEVNGVLVVSHGDTTVRLYQGDATTLGGFDVTCLTARFLTYSSTCSDAGAFEVAYTIRRL